MGQQELVSRNSCERVWCSPKSDPAVEQDYIDVVAHGASYISYVSEVCVASQPN